ncbi:MAG: alpha/beta hydrolase [Hyphomonadaceae bacterium]
MEASSRTGSMTRAAFGAVGLIVIGLAGCTPLGLNTASANIEKQEAARPDVLGAFEGDPPVTTAAEWTDRRAPILRKAFERDLYGPVPVELHGVETGRRVIDADYANGAGVLEEIDIRVGEGANAFTYQVAIAYPKGASDAHPVPLILNQNFGGTPGAFDSDELSGGGMSNEGMMAGVIRLIFGKYIIEGPNEAILRRGYAYASFSAEPFASDSKRAYDQMKQMAALLAPDRAPEGVIAVWAAAFSWSLDVLDRDPRLDASRTAVWGHSRQGKAALLAAAFDDRIEAAIPLQAGKGGATLTRSYAGESVKQITKAYPYWFAPAYAGYAKREEDIPVDQHQLIALVAPRPLLLGNGWKDVWSDPNGGYRAAVGADPVYRLFGVEGLTQTGMRDQTRHGRIDFFIRGGGHGVRVEDWDYMLDWLDQTLPAPEALQAAH